MGKRIIQILYHTKRPVFQALVLFLCLFMMLSCHPARKIIREPIKEEGADYLFEKLKENEFRFDLFSARFSIDLTVDKKNTTFTGQLRMKRDSIIWISMSPALGIEMARVTITGDSVKFLNRINKTYFSGNHEEANKLLNSNIDYDVIQSLLIGNDLTYYENGKFRASVDKGEYHLVTAGRGKLKKYVKTQQDEERIYIQNIFLDPSTFKVSSMKIKELKKDNMKLNAIYSEFEKIESQLFPMQLNYMIEDKNPVNLKVDYNKIEINRPLEFPMNIPAKYTPVVTNPNQQD